MQARNEAELLAIEMPRLNNNPTNLMLSPAFALTQDEQRNARSRQAVAEVPAVPEVQVTAPTPITGMEEVTVTAPRMSSGEARAYDARETLRTTLSEIMAQHRREQDARNRVEAEMTAGQRALVSLGGIMYNGYQSVKSGVVGLKDLAVSAYEWDQRVIGDLLHGDFRAAAGEYADLFGLGVEKAQALVAGAQNLGTVLADAESRDMLLDFAKEYYGTSSQVTQSELLGKLPMELLIAAGTAGAGEVISAAGIPQRIGGAIQSLSEAMSGSRLARNAGSGTFYKVESGGVRGEMPLTFEQRAEVESYLAKLDMDGVTVRWVDDRNLNTAYGDMFGERMLNIGSDVVPGNVGVGTRTANSRVSINGTLAHEIVGHMEAGMAGKTQDLLHLEEAQASIRAARFAPDLTSTERFTLLRDGITRLQNAPGGPVRIRDVKSSLYIWNR